MASAAKNLWLHARMLLLRAGSLGVGRCAPAQIIGPSENELGARVLGWVSGVYYLITEYPPLPPPPSIFRVMGLGVVWLVKSRCQRTYRSKSRKQGSYGRSLARLVRVPLSRRHCYCLNNYGMNWKRAQRQMSQGSCGKLGYPPLRLEHNCTRSIENGDRPVCPRISPWENWGQTGVLGF